MNRYPEHEHEYEADYSQVLCIHCGATQPTAPPNCPKCGHRWGKHDGRDDRLPNQPCCTQYAGMGEPCGCEDLPPAPHSRACGIRRHDHGPECHTNCPTCHGRGLIPRPSAPTHAQHIESEPHWLEEAYGVAMNVLDSVGVDERDDRAVDTVRAVLPNFDAQLAVKYGYLTFNTPRGTP